MKNKLLIALLIASLAVNLALTLTWLRRPRITAAKQPGNSSLLLHPEQNKSVNEIIHDFKIESLLLKDDILGKRVEIIEEIASPECDAREVDRCVHELNELENKLNELYVNVIINISEVLDPDQRLMLLYNLSREWYALTPPASGREK